MTPARVVTVKLACGHIVAYRGAEAPPEGVAIRGLYRCGHGCGVKTPVLVHTYHGRAAA